MKAQNKKTGIASVFAMLAMVSVSAHARSVCHYENDNAAKEEMWQSENIGRAQTRLASYKGNPAQIASINSEITQRTARLVQARAAKGDQVCDLNTTTPRFF